MRWPRLARAITILMLSRVDPPATLARAEANRLLGRIGADELRLTAEEMREIALAERAIDEPTLKLLQDRSGGWAAGLVLMLEHLKVSGTWRPHCPARHSSRPSTISQGRSSSRSMYADARRCCCARRFCRA